MEMSKEALKILESTPQSITTALTSARIALDSYHFMCTAVGCRGGCRGSWIGSNNTICPVCEGTGSIFSIFGKHFPNTREGIVEAMKWQDKFQEIFEHRP
jgi:hypothetical protein